MVEDSQDDPGSEWTGDGNGDGDGVDGIGVEDGDSVGVENGEGGTDESTPRDGAAGNGQPARTVGAAEARSLALEQAEALLTDPVEDVIEVQSGDGEWHVALEALEREAVPDTQDILARYEFTIAEDGTLSGYGLAERYRRGDLRGGL